MLPAGIEPTLPAPQASVLSVERRERGEEIHLGVRLWANPSNELSYASIRERSTECIRKCPKSKGLEAKPRSDEIGKGVGVLAFIDVLEKECVDAVGINPIKWDH